MHDGIVTYRNIIPNDGLGSLKGAMNYRSILYIHFIA